MHRVPLLLLSSVALAASACTPADPADGPSDAGRASMGPAADTGTAAPDSSLLGIMQGLERDMDRVQHALWRDDFALLREAARSVADHPRVTATERSSIAAVLGPDMQAFAAADARVHDTAVELSEHAGAGDADAVLDALARLQEACVGCHVPFRERVRTRAP